MARFSVTYDVVTEDSARDGDVAESGFASPGGWKHDDRSLLTLREAIAATGRYYSRHGCGFEDGGCAFYTSDSDTNYRTGEDTSYAIHPPRTITASSYRRVSRILTGR
jgi:hypothetical protein